MSGSTRISGAIISTIIMTTTGALGPRTGPFTASANADRRDVDATHERLLRGFEEQSDAEGRTQFVSRTPDSAVVLSGDDAMLLLPDTALHMRLVGAAPSAQADPLEEVGGKSHYLIGNDPAKWRTNLRTFARVRFREVYRGVDLIYYGRGQKLEYDFVVAPGADADRIHLRFDGADRVTLDDDGGLRLRMAAGDIRMDPPHLYQEAARGRRTIPGRYVLDGARGVRFEIGAYDHSARLTIDPVVTYSTYFGGRGRDASLAVAVDEGGFIYLTGRTGGVDVNTFPTVNALQPDFHAIQNAFITKLTPDGSTVVYSTYFGGSLLDEGRAIAVDRHGRVYVAGTTNSEDFPQVNPVQATCGGAGDAFVAKLDASGSALEYSTCLGGQSNSEEGFGIALDDDGNAYVTGYTRSRKFPTKHALQRRHAGGDLDAFLSVIRPGGSDFVYSTFLGGTGSDEGRGIAIDDKRNVYLTGRTRSTDFPVRDAFQQALRGESDAFVTKIDGKGQQIVYSTYLGGEVGLSDDGIPLSRGGDEMGLAIAVDARGEATVTGRTNSTDLPTLNAVQPHLGGPQHPSLGLFTTDAFVARFDATGVASYLTYAGGNSNDEPTAIALDAKGVAWITGLTESADFPSVRARQPAFGDGRVFSSPDAGATWHAASGGVGHRNVLAMALDPTDPAVMYAGTFGGGVFKTVDGGLTWAAINTGLANLFVDSLVIDPVHPSRLFAGTDGGGVFRTLDGGATWTLSLGPAGLPVTAMAIAPSNPSIVYAGAAARGFGAVFTSADGGDTWRRAPTDLVRGLTVDPVTPSTVYAGTNAGLFKSTDGGLTFVFHQVGNFFNPVNALAVDPSHPSTVYAGTDSAVTTSTDGGVTWAFRTSGFIGTVHALALQASSPSTLYAGTSNGVFKTTDGGNTWTATTAGLTSPFVNALVIDAGNPSQVYAGSLGTTDTFVMAFRPNGTIRYSSFLGGNGEEVGGGIAIGRRRQIYLTGGTASSDFLTVNPVQPTHGGFGDAFVTVLSRTRR